MVASDRREVTRPSLPTKVIGNLTEKILLSTQSFSQEYSHEETVDNAQQITVIVMNSWTFATTFIAEIKNMIGQRGKEATLA